MYFFLTMLIGTIIMIFLLKRNETKKELSTHLPLTIVLHRIAEQNGLDRIIKDIIVMSRIIDEILPEHSRLYEAFIDSDLEENGRLQEFWQMPHHTFISRVNSITTVFTDNPSDKLITAVYGLYVSKATIYLKINYKNM